MNSYTDVYIGAIAEHQLTTLTISEFDDVLAELQSDLRLPFAAHGYVGEIFLLNMTGINDEPYVFAVFGMRRDQHTYFHADRMLAKAFQSRLWASDCQKEDQLLPGTRLQLLQRTTQQVDIPDLHEWVAKQANKERRRIESARGRMIAAELRRSRPIRSFPRYDSRVII